MRIRCTSETLTTEQLAQLEPCYNPEISTFHLSVGDEFEVYAIWIRRGVVWANIKSPIGYLRTVPLFLFDVVEPRLKYFWEFHVVRNDEQFIGPPDFLQECFYDDLIEGEAKAFAALQDVERMMAADDHT